MFFLQKKHIIYSFLEKSNFSLNKVLTVYPPAIPVHAVITIFGLLKSKAIPAPVAAPISEF